MMREILFMAHHILGTGAVFCFCFDVGVVVGVVFTFYPCFCMFVLCKIVSFMIGSLLIAINGNSLSEQNIINIRNSAGGATGK